MIPQFLKEPYLFILQDVFIDLQKRFHGRVPLRRETVHCLPTQDHLNVYRSKRRKLCQMSSRLLYQKNQPSQVALQKKSHYYDSLL